MAREISEADWKLFRQLHPIALDRFCERVLSEVTQSAAAAGQTNHERYRAVFTLMKQRDRELATAFDDMRRSTALRQLACIRSYGLITDEEFARFSPETRSVVEVFLGG
jgi:hypothetical protein